MLAPVGMAYSTKSPAYILPKKGFTILPPMGIGWKFVLSPSATNTNLLPPIWEALFIRVFPINTPALVVSIINKF